MVEIIDTCPHCEAKNRGNRERCWNCGRGLSDPGTHSENSPITLPSDAEIHADSSVSAESNNQNPPQARQLENKEEYEPFWFRSGCLSATAVVLIVNFIKLVPDCIDQRDYGGLLGALLIPGLFLCWCAFATVRNRRKAILKQVDRSEGYPRLPE